MATVRLFVSSGQFIGGGQTQQFDFFQAVDAAYWHVSVVPIFSEFSTNANLEIIRIFFDTQQNGAIRLHYVVRNNETSGRFFTRAAIRAPEWGALAFSFPNTNVREDESMAKLHVAYTEDGTIVAAAVEGGDPPHEEVGLTVAELDVPGDVGDQPFERYLENLTVDTQKKTLRSKKT
jgi:hypothetical protein